jgi:hypothetical protein
VQGEWLLRGSRPDLYESGLDESVRRNGRATRYMRSERAADQGFATWLTPLEAGKYRGKRVRLSAMIRSQEVEAWAGLWMRVDRGAEQLAFDNMQDRAIHGTTEWTRYEVVLDVDPSADFIFLGVLQSGNGTTWLDEVELEIVGADVASTDLMASREDLSPLERPVEFMFELLGQDEEGSGDGSDDSD